MVVITRYQVKGVSWIENKRESGIPKTLTQRKVESKRMGQDTSGQY